MSPSERKVALPIGDTETFGAPPERWEQLNQKQKDLFRELWWLSVRRSGQKAVAMGEGPQFLAGITKRIVGAKERVK